MADHVRLEGCPLRRQLRLCTQGAVRPLTAVVEVTAAARAVRLPAFRAGQLLLVVGAANDERGDAEASAVGPIRAADLLGWTSVALGAPMILAPRRVLRAVGVRADRRSVGWILLVGARELMATAQLNAMRHRRVGMWARVVGDTMDLALLAAAYTRRRERAERLLGAVGFVAGILGVDLVTALRLNRAEGAHLPEGAGSSGTGATHDTGGGAAHVRTAITIRKPEDEVRSAFSVFPWEAFDPAGLEASGALRFVPAPGGRGVELHLDHDPRVPGGTLGVAALKLAGSSPEQRISDELRRFKAQVETGVLVRSDKTPEGASSARQIKQLPGNPDSLER